MYVDSINNSFGNQSVISGFCNTLICSSNASDSEKIITVPNGYTNTDAYVTIRVLFLNGYYDTSTINNPMTLTVQHEDGTYFDGTSTPTSYPIKSYQNGVLDNLQIHEITQTDYRVIDPNTCIELYFDGTQFVVVGNPLVLSSSDYSIYANGKIVDDKDNLLSDRETVTITTTDTTMDYDGYLYISVSGGPSPQSYVLYINSDMYSLQNDMIGSSTFANSSYCFPFRKGDKIHTGANATSSYYAQYYKQRYYGGRN